MVSYSHLPDIELLQLLKQSDHSAYTEIYHRYFHLMYVHAYKKLRDEAQAEDIVQELFAKLWFKRDFIDIDQNLSAYLYSAIRNKIFDLFAHEKVKSKYLDSLQDYVRSGQSVPTDSRIREKQLQAHIDKEIAALPPKMQRIFEMSRKEGLSHKEIAKELSTSENNISTQVTSALRILRTKLGLFIYLFLMTRL
ncbi:RNA polymerase sigma-70 factor [Mucilaginibacter kameinonensis]|uniref:RNA polymerase sigma-70 factor n=1 Tax=Mucilaginibacter kameinonensis TaxID=452286 RepID=UPI000EF75FC5|nr:RNA polymerase sigma-70 factor [Mucilaginibacter kameinonensis]